MPSPGPSYADRGRAESFGSVAANYDRFRPTYPPRLIDDLVALEPRAVLDVGCGTGKAARLFAERALDVLGVEIDPKMAEIARSYGIPVEVGSFEDWDAAGRTFDLLVSGQAWHWVDPARGVPKAAEVLRPSGAVALFWNHDHPNDQLRARLDAVYQEYAPELITPPETDHAQVRRSRLLPFEESPDFSAITWRSYDWERDFSADEWVGMTLTYSDHVLLAPVRRAALAEAMRNALPDGMTVAYETYLALISRV